MSRYLDIAHVAKCYLNEPDADRVRALVAERTGLTSSAACRAGMTCVIQRHVREGGLTRPEGRALHDLFLEDVASGACNRVPVSGDVLADVEARLRRLRRSIFLRAGEAIHLSTAARAGFRDVGTSDRHLLAAAPRFGLRGRTA